MKAIGRYKDGEIICAVGYDGFNGASCQMHVSGTGNWINKEILRAAFDYPFNTCGLNMVLGLIPSGNTEAIRLNKHLGFAILHRIGGAHPDGELIIMGMYKSQCRWING
jgi:RimJ/RimL family protein N-acetyltransferase